MRDKRQKNQLQLAFLAEARSEAPNSASEGIESPIAEHPAESPTTSEHLMEEVCERENLKKALRRVKANKGSPGIDGMSVEELPEYLKEHWPIIREQLLAGTYRPAPVKRVEIPKPAGGGTRKLGIPTALDRFIQQAVLQVLQPSWDATFSAHSYGFRPGRSQHQAVAQAQHYIAEGYRVVVDIDLEKFFDQVNHDILMERIARRVDDKRVLKLIRAYLRAGVMENGLVSATERGTPQGSPLSPLLSNLILDELDKELERRGLRFCRYADDSNIYVKSERAGQRVMASVSQFINRKLKLRVNQEKSAVGRPSERKFLGFTFTADDEPKRKIAPQAIKRFKDKVREITRRSRGISVPRMAEELREYLQGWSNYFGYCQTPIVLRDLDSWVRRKLRCYIWKQWETKPNRYQQMRKLGVRADHAKSTADSSHGPWPMSRTPSLHKALDKAYFRKLGVPELEVRMNV
jgi:RNA-directed DNA polymerase